MNRSRACGRIGTSMNNRPDAVILDVIPLDEETRTAIPIQRFCCMRGWLLNRESSRGSASCQNRRCRTGVHCIGDAPSSILLFCWRTATQVPLYHCSLCRNWVAHRFYANTGRLNVTVRSTHKNNKLASRWTRWYIALHCFERYPCYRSSDFCKTCATSSEHQ